MPVKYLVEEWLIPDDGSKKIIENFISKTEDRALELLVYPDVHYKKGSRVVNGMLTASDKYIYPAMLGVANCGFTFGKIENVTIHDKEILEKTFEEYSKILKAYNKTKIYTNHEIYDLFDFYLEKFYHNKKYKELYNFVDFTCLEDLKKSVKEILTKKHIEVASKTLGTLGGGNHFFEIQYIEESYDDNFQEGDIIFILHSDSIAVGDKISLLFSNLSELDHMRYKPRGELIRLINRMRQIHYFILKTKLFFLEPQEVINLLYSQNDYRKIDAASQTGKTLIKAFLLATIFGDMNRDMILSNYERIANQIFKPIKLAVMGSHSHDSLMIEKNYNDIKIVQRNGVQCVSNDPYFILPGALGTESYLMKNTNNENAYFSANHGVGRFLDKHVAKVKFTNEVTQKELEKRNMKLYRVGSGNIAEQNPNAFKNVYEITDLMQRKKLGIRVAKLRPICSMKG